MKIIIQIENLTAPEIDALRGMIKVIDTENSKKLMVKETPGGVYSLQFNCEINENSTPLKVKAAFFVAARVLDILPAYRMYSDDHKTVENFAEAFFDISEIPEASHLNLTADNSARPSLNSDATDIKPTPLGVDTENRD